MIKHYFSFLLLLIFASKISAQNCTINAGVASTYCPGQTMKLYGNISGLYNGTTVTWSQISGPATTIVSPNSLTTDCGIAASGATYVFRISATCQDGSTVLNNVTFTVLNATPQPPPTNAGNTINAGCLQFGQSINLNASPAPIGFVGTWTIENGGLGTFSNINNPIATFTPSQASQWDCPTLSNSYILKWTLRSSVTPPVQCPQAITTSSAIVNINVSMFNIVDARVVTPGCGNTSTNVNLYGTCPGTGTSSWSLISGPVGYTYPTTNTQNIVLTAPPSGTYTFRYTVVAGCISGTKNLTFTVDLGANNFVTTANANAGNITKGFCNGLPASIQLSANNPNSGETGTWSQTSGGTAVIFSNINDPNAVVSGITNAGSPYTFNWTIANTSGCSNSSSITISSINLGNNSPINFTLPCAISVVENGPPPTDGGTYCTSFSKYIAYDAYIPTQIPIPSNAANGWYFKGFNLYSKPTNATNTIGFTAGQTSFNFDGTVSPFNSRVKDCAGPGFGFQFAPSGGFFAISQALSYPYVPGVYEGSWVLKNNLCLTEVVIPFKLTYTGNTTASNAGTDQNLACALTQTNLSGNDPLATPPFYGQGIWVQISGPNNATIVNKYNRNSQITGLISGTYNFIWQINAGDFCTPNQDTVAVRVSSAAPSDVFAGANQTVCYNTQIVVTASLAAAGSLQNMLSNTGSTGIWSQISGPAGAVITSPASISTNITGLAANATFVFRYTASNFCGTKTSDITITTSPTQGPSQANAGADICLNNGITNVILTATAPLVGAGTWSQISGPSITTISTPNNNTTTITGLITNGIYGFLYTVSTSGCSLSKDTVYVSNTAAITNANAGADQNICATLGVNSFSLNANAVTIGTGTWTQIFGPVGATFSNPNASNTLVTVISNGNYIFRWTVSNGGICPDKTDDVTINFYTKPSLAVISTPNTSLCASSNGQLVLNATPITSGFASWSVLNNGPGIISNPNNATTNVIVNAGTTVIRWTVSSVFSGCPATFADVIVRYTPAANANQNQNLCRSTSTILRGSTPGAGSGNWSVISQPIGSPIVSFTSQGNDSTFSANPLLAGTYFFKWTVTEATCGVTSDDVIVTIDDVTNPNAGLNRCDTVSTGAIILVGNPIPLGATAIWSKLSGPNGAFSTPTAATTNYTPTAFAGTMVFQYQFTKGACVLNDYVQIRAISNVNAGANIVQCNNGIFTLNGSSLAIGEIGIWTKLNNADPGIITNINANNTTVTGLNLGDSINLIWTATTSEGCIKSDTVALINKAEIIASTNFSVVAYCDNPLGINLIGNNPSSTSGAWSLISAPVAAPPIIWTNQYTNNANVKNLTIGAYYFRYTLNNLPCAPSTKDVIIKSNCEAILPVTIESFQAIPNKKEVILNWNVAIQINIHHYQIEHSTNGINFNAFTTVNANNYLSYNYSTIHTYPVKGINYYRLKIVENDGTFYYSEIRTVNIYEQISMIEIYPIPAKNNLTITFSNNFVTKNTTINIYAADGKLVYKKNIIALSQTENLDISTLKNGTYFLKVITEKEIVNKKISVVK